MDSCDPTFKKADDRPQLHHSSAKLLYFAEFRVHVSKTASSKWNKKPFKGEFKSYMKANKTRDLILLCFFSGTSEKCV